METELQVVNDDVKEQFGRRNRLGAAVTQALVTDRLSGKLAGRGWQITAARLRRCGRHAALIWYGAGE